MKATGGPSTHRSLQVRRCPRGGVGQEQVGVARGVHGVTGGCAALPRLPEHALHGLEAAAPQRLQAPRGEADAARDELGVDAEAMGGRATVTSTPGHGAAFGLELDGRFTSP